MGTAMLPSVASSTRLAKASMLTHALELTGIGSLIGLGVGTESQCWHQPIGTGFVNSKLWNRVYTILDCKDTLWVRAPPSLGIVAT